MRMCASVPWTTHQTPSARPIMCLVSNWLWRGVQGPWESYTKVNNLLTLSFLFTSDLYIICIHSRGTINSAGKCLCPEVDLRRQAAALYLYTVQPFRRGVVFLFMFMRNKWFKKKNINSNDSLASGWIFPTIQFKETDVCLVTKWLSRCFQFGSWTAKLHSAIRHSLRHVGWCVHCFLFSPKTST